MSEDSLEKFVANMRAIGQSDELTAQTLIGAGHNKIVVLNALGVSSLDELHEDEPEDTGPSQITVDENGQIQYQHDELKASPQSSPSAPEEATAPQQPASSGPRRATRPVKRHELHRLANIPSKPASEATEEIEEPTTQSQNFTPRNPVSAVDLHSHGAASGTPRSVQAGPTQNTKSQSAQEHLHSYKETMQSLAEHKEIEAASHHDLASGITPEKPFSPQNATAKPDEDEHSHPESSDETVEVTLTQPKAMAQEKILPTAPPEEELPQELNTEDLEMVDGDLHNMKKDIDGLDLQNQKAPVVGPLDAASFAHQVSDAEKLNLRINSLKNNTWLHVFIIVLCVAVLIGLAATVATQIL